MWDTWTCDTEWIGMIMWGNQGYKTLNRHLDMWYTWRHDTLECVIHLGGCDTELTGIQWCDTLGGMRHRIIDIIMWDARMCETLGHETRNEQALVWGTWISDTEWIGMIMWDAWMCEAHGDTRRRANGDDYAVHSNVRGTWAYEALGHVTLNEWAWLCEALGHVTLNEYAWLCEALGHVTLNE